MNFIFSQSLLSILLFSIIFLHLTKKNIFAVMAYSLQSSVIFVFLCGSFLETRSPYLLAVVILTLVVKIILASAFFIRLIKKHALTFSVSTYLNMPTTLIVVSFLVFFAHSSKFSALTQIIPANQPLLSLALAALFISLFLIINRKGAFSQILGILSIENSIVAFAIFAGLEQSPGLQIGILFNILIWIIIATVFISMLYKHFGTLDVTAMKNLRD